MVFTGVLIYIPRFLSPATGNLPIRLSPELSSSAQAPKKKKNKSRKGKAGKSKASFKRSGVKKGTLKKGDTKVKGVDQEKSEYKGYDISMLPLEAHPDHTRPNLGSHSYTLSFKDATVEVLLAKQAYYVKKVNDDGSGPTGQISWTKHGGPVDAFAVAKIRSGLDRYATCASLD